MGMTATSDWPCTAANSVGQVTTPNRFCANSNSFLSFSFLSCWPFSPLFFFFLFLSSSKQDPHHRHLIPVSPWGSDRPFHPSTNSSCSPRCTPLIFFPFRVFSALDLVPYRNRRLPSVACSKRGCNNNNASFSVSAPSVTRAGILHYLSFSTLFRSIITPTASGPTLSEVQFLNRCAQVPRPRVLPHIPPNLFQPCLLLATFARPLSSQSASSSRSFFSHISPS